MPLDKINDDTKRIVSEVSVKLLKEKQEQKQVGQRITDEKIEAYGKYLRTKHEKMVMPNQPLEYYGLDEQTVRQLDVDRYEIRVPIVLAVRQAKDLEAAEKQKLTSRVESKMLTDIDCENFGFALNLMLNNLASAHSRDKEATLAVLFEMLKEKQKEKQNVWDRIPDEFIDKLTEIALSGDQETACKNKVKEIFNLPVRIRCNPMALSKLTTEARQIKRMSSFKARVAAKKQEMGMKK